MMIENLQIVGKDIIRFHAIYWPIFLMALDLPIPKKIYAHGFIMMKDGKMSKSKGNIVYPELLIDRYGLDALKYFLLRECPFAVFNPESFIERFNFDLCNDLGNLLNRTIGMLNKYFEGKVPALTTIRNDVDSEIEQNVIEKVKQVEDNMDDIHVSNAISEIWAIISRSNKYIDETAPWILAKSEVEEDRKKLASVMYHLIENLRIVAVLLQPFMKDTSNKMFEQLGIKDEKLKTWESAQEYGKIKQNMQVVPKGEPLFMRLDVDEEIQYIKDGMNS